MRSALAHPAVLSALGAALLFGASTPLAKQFVGDSAALLLAGLLYLGSGIGLTVVRLIRDRGWRSAHLRQHEWPMAVRCDWTVPLQATTLAPTSGA